MSSDYTIRLLRPGEESEVQGLLNEAFRGWPHFDLTCSPSEHWRWKHLDNPLGESNVVVAEKGGEIVGCMHLMFNRLKLGSLVYLCTQSGDAAVLQSHRESGVFTKIRAMSDEIIANGVIGVQYGVTSNPAVAKTLSRIDQQRHRVTLSMMVRIDDVNAYTKSYNPAKKVLLTSGYHGARLLSSLKSVRVKGGGDSSKLLEVSDITGFDDRVGALWAESCGDYDLVQELSLDYLNWRFCDSRGGKYVVRQAEEDGVVVGFSVLRVSQFGANPPSGYVVALHCLPERLDCASALVDDALSYFRGRQVNSVRYCVSKGHPYEGLLMEKGFVVAPGDVLFTTFPKSIGDDFDVYKNASATRVLFQYGSFDWI